MASPFKVLVGYCCWISNTDMEAELLLEWGVVDELLLDLVQDQQVIIIIIINFFITIIIIILRPQPAEDEGRVEIRTCQGGGGLVEEEGEV